MRTGPLVSQQASIAVCGGLVGLAVVALIAAGSMMALSHARDDGRGGMALTALKAQYRRPGTLPVPAGNPLTGAKIALGARLFQEKRLSVDDTKSCASCHDPLLGFADGVEIGEGVQGRKPDRHTPHLWNLAWAKTLFWDGRAASLEEQARGPIENPKEMAQTLADGVRKIAGDPSYAEAFAEAFPAEPEPSEENVLKALAAYERTLVSPSTRFDSWIMGDDGALTANEVEGFVLFNGKARCSVCHSGWNFTDHAFHDIGLPGGDLGRGPVINLKGVDHAFKTPSLRELTWTAPYMHDGGLATIEEVIRYYEAGGVKRPSRSPDMPNTVGLTDRERENLIAFLETLSSERPPRPAAQLLESASGSEGAEAAIAATSVRQKGKQFRPGALVMRRGVSLTVINDDTRPHNFRIFDPRLKFDSGLQEPGEKAVVPMELPGKFEAFCGIHPNMRLSIEVQ